MPRRGPTNEVERFWTKVVKHEGDSYLCVGSYADNSHDAVERGRTARGERGGTSKFTEEDVHEIRRLWRSGVRQVELARRYNVTQPAISAVCTGKNWGHV